MRLGMDVFGCNVFYRLQKNFLLLRDFIALGVPVYVFHHVIRLPAAELQDIGIRYAEGMRVAGEVMPEHRLVFPGVFAALKPLLDAITEIVKIYKSE